MIYYIDAERLYLASVAKFVLHSYANLENVRIIVPSSNICTYLQCEFVKNANVEAAILPNIVPISSLHTSCKLLHLMQHETMDLIEYTTQKILLIDVLVKYSQESNGFKFNHIEAVHVVDELLHLIKTIDVDNISNIFDIESAAHFQMSAEFLTTVRAEFYAAITRHHKIDEISLQNLVLEYETQLSQYDNTVVVGLMSGNKKIMEFLKSVTLSSDGVLILPPVIKHKISDDILPVHPMYKHKKFLDLCGVNMNQISLLPFVRERYVSRAVEYIEAPDLRHEAEAIAKIAIVHCGNRVGIIPHNTSLVHYINTSLAKRGYVALNFYGEPILQTKEVEFILLLVEFTFAWTIEKLLALLKTPYFDVEQVYQLELEVRKRRIYKIENINGYEWLDNLLGACSAMHNFQNVRCAFGDILKAHIKCITSILPDIWSSDVGASCANFFADLELSAKFLSDINAESYQSLLKELIRNVKYFPNIESNIVIARPEDAALMDFDIVIIAGCNEGALPERIAPNCWLNNNMSKTLNLDDELENIGYSNYCFQSVFHKQAVYITRSMFIDGIESIQSPFIVNALLDIRIGDSINTTPQYNWFSDSVVESDNRGDESASIQSHMFPENISATDIELLIRNPYGFYAKKILRLKKLREVNETESLADFGNIVHQIFSEYTDKYDASTTEKLMRIIDIGRDVFARYHHLGAKRILWWERFMELAPNFIAFDDERRAHARHIYSEVYGETVLTINGRPIKILAIADRIEISDRGLYILDYKTGSIPSKQEVYNGVSPQLVVSAIIAHSGGFNGIDVKDVTKLIYVKLSSQGTLTEHIIDIDIESILQHKSGLVKLLEYYTSENAIFINCPREKYAPKYNDYDHLSRAL